MHCITLDLFSKRQVTESLTLFAAMLFCLFSIIIGVYILSLADFFKD